MCALTEAHRKNAPFTFTYSFVLMTDNVNNDVNYTYFVLRFIGKHKTINIVFFLFIYGYPVVLRHLKGDRKILS